MHPVKQIDHLINTEPGSHPGARHPKNRNLKGECIVKEQYTKAEIEIVLFQSDDVITTSDCGYNPNETAEDIL